MRARPSAPSSMAFAVALLLSSAFASAQAAPEPTPPPPETPAPPSPDAPPEAPSEPDPNGNEPPGAEEPAPSPETNRAKEQARAHFLRGLELLEEKAYDAALVEFNRSRALFPTRGNALNAAVALRELGRFDEALVIFNELLADDTMTPEERERLENEIRLLDGLLGSVELRGVVPKARVIVDGREVARTPLVAPLRLSAGTRFIRILAEDFEPYERRVDVPARGSIALDVEMIAASELIVVRPKKDDLPKYEGMVIGVDANVVFAALTAGSTAACIDECKQTTVFGGLGLMQLGWEFGNGVGLAGEVGALIDWQRRKNDIRTLVGEDYADSAPIEETTSIASGLAGATGYYRFFSDKVPILAGLSVGGGVGRLSLNRGGRFINDAGNGFDVAVSESHFVPSLYMSPYFRVGWPLSDNVEIAVDLRVLVQVLLTSTPWENEELVSVPDQGPARFDDTLSVRPLVSLLLSPGVGLRWQL